MTEDTEVVLEEGEAKKSSTRRKYRDDSWTAEQVAARRAELTVEEVPDGWVKLADVSQACRDNSIAVSRLVRATGGDRGMGEPAAPIFKIVYVGRTRYMAPGALKEGLTLLQDETFMPTQRKGRKKAEAGEESEAEEATPAKKTTRKKKTATVRPAPSE